MNAGNRQVRIGFSHGTLHGLSYAGDRTIGADNPAWLKPYMHQLQHSFANLCCRHIVGDFRIQRSIHHQSRPFGDVAYDANNQDSCAVSSKAKMPAKDASGVEKLSSDCLVTRPHGLAFTGVAFSERAATQ